MSASTISLDCNLSINDKNNENFDDSSSLHKTNEDLNKQIKSDNKNLTNDTLKPNFLRRSNFWKLR
jgi:hypothetical protein